MRRLRGRAGGCGGAEVLCWPKRSVCGCLRGSCPGDFPDNFYLEALDHHHRRGRSLPASQGAWPPPGSNSMTLLLPCTHMLTRTAISTFIGRSLVAVHNYGHGSTTSRRAHAAATVSAPPRTARTAASFTHSQAPGTAAVVSCGRLASDLGWAVPGWGVLSGPAGDGRAEPP